MRASKIESLLVMVGADSSTSTIAMVDSLIDFIPTPYLKHFTEYVLKNYDKHKKPIVNITSVSQEYKKRLQLSMIKKGEFRLTSVEDTKAFLLEFFKGQEICNCIDGLYFPFVVIQLNDKEEFINKYSFNKLDSLEVADFIYWCFLNQDRIGEVKLLQSETVKDLMLENKNKIDMLQIELTDSQKSTNYDLVDTSVSSLVNVALKVIK